MNLLDEDGVAALLKERIDQLRPLPGVTDPVGEFAKRAGVPKSDVNMALHDTAPSGHTRFTAGVLRAVRCERTRAYRRLR